MIFNKEKYYFLGDALCHFFNIIMYYQSKSYLLLGFWGFLFLVHMFYFMHLIKYDFPLAENNLYPIFKWSCIGYKKDRFSFKESGSEMIQTILDILGHIFGAIFIVQGPYFWMFPWASLLVLISSLVFFRFYKYFVTEESMMPKKLITITKRLKSF